MRDEENIREVEALGIDGMGFIFWPKSSRYVSVRPAYLPKMCKRVGVFVDASIDDIRQHINDYALDIIQLHGHETPDFIHSLRSLCGDSIATIKAFNIATKEDLETTKPYKGIVDYFLFDTKGKSVGGNGEKFDWSVLDSYDGDTPFLLSGGIGPDDAERVKSFHHPKCVGIDLNSKFEVRPALKDTHKLKEFINTIRYEQQD
jgi:phosphoribosylanthranilate isomerase